MQLGSKYGMALSKSMHFLKDTRVVDLPGNRLGKVGGSAIISNLIDKVKVLNLDNNHIGEEGLLNLVSWIENPNRKCSLESLSLENNDVGDDFTVKLL